MHVIMGCRKVEDGYNLVSSIRDEGITSGKATIRRLDLASLESVRNFANAVLQDTFKINYIINNAACVIEEYTETVDKFECLWQVNYLSHFLLCHLLLPTVQSSVGPTRILHVSSVAHRVPCAINYKQLSTPAKYDVILAYGRAKLALVMLSFYLNDKLKSIGSRVEAVVVNPGFCPTDIYHTAPVAKHVASLNKYFMKTSEDAAKGIVHAALYGQGGVLCFNGGSETPASCARDKAQQHLLFQHSKEALRISSFGNIF